MIDLKIKELPMQHAYVNNFTEEGLKGDYNIISKDQESLGVWPKSLGDRNIHPMLKFVRRFEKEAYLKGRADEEENATIYIIEMKKRYEEKINKILEANNMLANKLEEFIGE